MTQLHRLAWLLQSRLVKPGCPKRPLITGFHVKPEGCESPALYFHLEHLRKADQNSHQHGLHVSHETGKIQYQGCLTSLHAWRILRRIHALLIIWAIESLDILRKHCRLFHVEPLGIQLLLNRCCFPGKNRYFQREAQLRSLGYIKMSLVYSTVR